MHDRVDARTRRPARPSAAAGSRAAADRLAAIHGAIGNRAIARVVGPADSGVGLPRNLRAGIEGLSGISMADVRVHPDSPRPSAIRAHAYTAGSHIYLSPGQERHLPHEAWHVVQQKQGRVEPRTVAEPIKVNDDPTLEAEADRMGAEATQPGDAPANAPAKTAPRAGLAVAPPPRHDVVQGKWFRMSTLLDDEDEREVAKIRETAETGNLVDAFLLVLSKHPGLSVSFRRLLEFARYSDDVAKAIDHILWETYDDSAKAFTAAEVMDLLDENEVTVEAADLLIQEDDREMDALIEQFGKLHIETFRSDVDDGRELHSVYWGADAVDVILESNPKPLKLVLLAKAWEAYPLTPPLVKQLQGLRKTAKHALYAISGNAKRSITGARTKAKMNTFRAALGAIAKILANLGGAAHQATLLPATDLSKSTKDIEGKLVIANPLSINSATSGSKPTDGRLMKAIRARAGPASKSYVQMHLLNDLVFGPGELWNLTPGPKQSNVDMERDVEDPLKRAVLGKGLVINFEARVIYANDPTTASAVAIAQNPDKYRFQQIVFKAEQLEYDPTSLTWKKAAKPDKDVDDIDGARVNWRYGGLEPLTPKPRILDPKTTWQELVEVGVQPAAAKRIVAFVNANAKWRPGGADRQKQLAAAVKAWDKQTRVPNVSSWKATAVLWS